MTTKYIVNIQVELEGKTSTRAVAIDGNGAMPEGIDTLLEQMAEEVIKEYEAVCELCEGKGYTAQPNGEDDFTKETCGCQDEIHGFGGTREALNKLI